jgi:structural maintenance of chromosome 3 (chondroitin sulfate proteoglycan 6)
MEVLQDRKNEAIVRTFKEVSVGFSKIFEKLVPSGKGKLIIQKKTKESKDGNTIFLSQYADTNDKEQLEDGNEESATDSSEEEEEINSIDSFVGISISVSFNSKKNEQQRLEQLSGGQKSLCALSLILAIQNCDPAPFYLFDEIDSNLDAQYRTAVASLIQRLSRTAQFICTTFRSEMLKVSDRYYGVMFNNKVSTVSNIDANRALDFVEDQQRV